MELSTASISSMNKLHLQNEVSNRVAVKAQDIQKAEGDQVLKMLESVPAPSASPTARSGLNIDPKA